MYLIFRVLLATSVELPSLRSPPGALARFRRFARISEIAALLAPVNAFVRPESLQDELGGARNGGRVVLRPDAQDIHLFEHARNLFQLSEKLLARSLGRNFQLASELKPLYSRLKVHLGEVPGKCFPNGRTNQLACDIIRAPKLALVFELEFSRHSRNRRIHVGHARDCARITSAHGASFGAAKHIFERTDRKPLAHARAAIDSLIISRLKRNLLK